MTVSNQNAKSGPYFGNGVTVSFDRTFRLLDEGDLRVVQTENGVDTVLTSGFTQTGVGQDTGTVVFSVAPADGVQITLSRNMAFEQTSDYSTEGAVDTEVIETDFDRVVMLLQQLQVAISDAVSEGAFGDVSFDDPLTIAGAWTIVGNWLFSGQVDLRGATVLGLSQTADNATFLGMTGGTGTAFTLTSLASDPITAYAAGLEYEGIAGASNDSGAATLNVDGVGAVDIRKYAPGNPPTKVALTPGDIQRGDTVRFKHDGTHWVMVSPQLASTSKLGLVKIVSAVRSAVLASASSVPTEAAVRALFDAIGLNLIAIGRIDGADGSPDYAFELGTDGVVTDLGVGRYGIDFDAAEPDSDYVALVSVIDGAPLRLFWSPVGETNAGFEAAVLNFNGASVDRDGVLFLAVRLADGS